MDAEPQGRNDFYDGKYQSVQDLENAHKELEQKLGNANASMSQRDISTILDQAGLDNEAMIHNWQSDGKLSEEQYGGLAKIGYGRTLVDTFLHGQHAIASQSASAQLNIADNASQMAGGEMELQNLLAWGGQHYGEGVAERLNQRLGDPSQYEGAIKEILYDYRQAVGSGFTAPLVTGQAMPNTASGFTSAHELVTAIKTARETGGMSEQVKRRIANTPQHIIQGMDNAP
jgi:hypothetical protein